MTTQAPPSTPSKDELQAALRFAVPDAQAHLANSKLDAIAAGELVDGSAAHLANCAACTDYVTNLRAEIAAASGDFAAPHADAFASAIAAKAAEPATAQVHALRPRSRLAYVGYAATALAMAAGIGLFLRTPLSHSGGANSSGSASSATLASSGTTSGQRFKGTASVAVVRESGGVQSRQTGPCSLKPNDRIRLEITTQGDDAIAAGVLSDTGEYFPLVPAEALTAGTHFSRDAMRFDDKPFKGWVVWGPPDKITALQQTRDVQSVQFLAISVIP
jgi:hypothetical protein